jgi:hypothetical protein
LIFSAIVAIWSDSTTHAEAFGRENSQNVRQVFGVVQSLDMTAKTSTESHSLRQNHLQLQREHALRARDTATSLASSDQYRQTHAAQR